MNLESAYGNYFDVWRSSAPGELHPVITAIQSALFGEAH
jgi:hypothetical protein